MTQLYSFLGDELVNALGWTFVHSLWQGSLVALIMTAILSRIPAQHAQQRYVIATISLISVLFCSMVTFALLYQQPTVAATGNDAFFTGIAAETEATSLSLYAWISQFNPFLVSIWIMGVLFFALRFCFGLFYLRHLKASASAAPAEWQETLDRIIQTLGFTRKVKLAQSALLKIPIVAGYLKPVILFPVGIINQLQIDEVEAILAHEVAHLVRNDFLQNLVQSLIEMIFYYHPAVWWISAVARSERENCCDDLAVQVCSNSLTYAKALVRLEDISYHAPALALPFAGSKGHLLNRIKRILNQPQNKSNVMERIIATVILIGCVTLLSFSERQLQAQTEADDVNISAEYHTTVSDTVPQQREITVWKTVDGKEMEMRAQNGQIKSLKVDGNVIDPSEYPAHEAEIEEMRAIAEDTPLLPPVPPMPPMPPVPSMAPVPPVPPMPPFPDMPPMPEMPNMPDMPAPAFFEHQFFTPEPPHEGRTNKTTIIRERSGDGYSYHVESEGNTDVEIDGDRGIATINGEEIELDADSVIVIVTEDQDNPRFLLGRNGRGEAGTPLFFESTDGDMIRYKISPEEMNDAQKAEWEAYEKAMKEWEKAAEGMKWDEYGKQMEEWGKQWENQDWKAYEEQMKVYGDKWEKDHAGEWKQYEAQIQDYARQLAEAEKESALSGEDRQAREERGLLFREQMEDAQAQELEHARILQLDDEGNLRMLHGFHDGEPFGPITSAMEREGLIDTEGEYNIILEEDKLRINGKRMPDDVHEKYLRLFERTQGYPISGKSKIEISN